jgi:hypothetical protein
MSFSHPAGRLANGQDGFSSNAPFNGGAPSTAVATNGPASANVDGYPMLSRSNSTNATTRTFFGREISGGTITNGNVTERVSNNATLKTAGQVPMAPGAMPPAANGTSNDDPLTSLNGRLSQLTINTQLNTLYNGTTPVVGPMSAPAITAPRNPIPADQNPPCNTLYVGNLPVNAQEDELRRLFSRMRGYKRLCFRPKPGTGPMCFVEFDDISCATHAMNELYGVPLSNSIKGGIRLSYSKNPLGVRQNFGPSTPTATSLSSSSSSQNTSQQFSQQQQQQQQQQSQSQHHNHQQQQLQQLRQAHLSSLTTATNGHSHLSLAQQQQLAQLKAAVAMKQRLEGGSGPGVPMTAGPGRLSLSGLTSNTGIGNIPLTQSMSAAPSLATNNNNNNSNTSNNNGSGSTNGTSASSNAINGNPGAAANGNPGSAASSPMQEPPSFRWLMEAL